MNDQHGQFRLCDDASRARPLPTFLIDVSCGLQWPVCLKMGLDLCRRGALKSVAHYIGALPVPAVRIVSCDGAVVPIAKMVIRVAMRLANQLFAGVAKSNEPILSDRSVRTRSLYGVAAGATPEATGCLRISR
ncbi:hypothetical protein NA647_11545 [Pseudomonas stutzeri]|uniref:hypothetical protein n=1 Tax=Stutzerimonas stutzeri TaxID=316 RepID=UPI00210D5F0E|nr:hypothetical protein [Stutzerimonas stutzeri]MCQ4288066.1 hypothetical protein [Stutzerimonas stutzeri]